MIKSIGDSKKAGHGGHVIRYIADNGTECSKIFISYSGSPSRGPRWFQSYSHLTFFIIINLVIVLIILSSAIYILLVKYAPLDKNESHTSFPGGNGTDLNLYTIMPEETTSRSLDPTVPGSTTNSTSSQVRIISRLEWVAQPPTNSPTKLKTPVPYVIIMHTNTADCSSIPQCTFNVRYIQIFHMEGNKWWDIGYNFLIGGDGNAYEGRGWTNEGAHTHGYNSRSIGVAFIGNFNKKEPTQSQLEVCKQLIQEGVRLGYISKDYKLFAARQLQVTESPGEKLYEEIKTWPHWAPTL